MENEQNYLQTADVLYVEDNEEIRVGYERPLRKYAKNLYIASNGEEGLKLFEQYAPDIIISDIAMPKMTGIEMVRKIRERSPYTSVVFTTAYTNSEYLQEAIDLQVDAYLAKPVAKRLLKQTVEKLSKVVALDKLTKQQQRYIQEQKEILQNIIDTEQNALVVTDLDTVTFTNKAFLKLLNLESTDAFHKKYTHFKEFFQQKKGYLYPRGNSPRQIYEQYLQTDENDRVVSINDRIFQLEISLMRHRDRELYLINLSDITSLETQKKMAQHRANTDKLTGLPNRNSFEDHFNTLQKSGRAFTLAIIDIDHFKHLNDTFGHLIGDEVLCELSSLLHAKVRKSDFIARWGGEEFVLLLQDTSLQEALQACEHLRNAIKTINHEKAGGITASFGLSCFKKGDDLKSLFSRADEALYRAKQNGRDRVEALQ